MRKGGVRVGAELLRGHVPRHRARLAVEAIRRQRPLRLHSGGGGGLRGGKRVVPVGPMATGIVATAAAAVPAAAAATPTVAAAAATTSATAATAATTTTAASVTAAATVTAAAAAAARASRHAKLFRRVTKVAALPKSARPVAPEEADGGTGTAAGRRGRHHGDRGGGGGEGGAGKVGTGRGHQRRARGWAPARPGSKLTRKAER